MSDKNVVENFVTFCIRIFKEEFLLPNILSYPRSSLCCFEKQKRLQASMLPKLFNSLCFTQKFLFVNNERPLRYNLFNSDYNFYNPDVALEELEADSVVIRIHFG